MKLVVILATFCALVVTTLCGCSATPGWTLHRDPHGFIVSIPGGWSVTYNTSNKAAIITGAGTHLVIRPAFAQQTVNAAQAQAIAQALAKNSAPSIGWNQARIVGNGVDSVTGSGGSRRGMAFMGWHTSQSGTVFYLYEADAPSASLQSRSHIIGAVFASFRLALPPRSIGNTPARLQYSTYREPNEGAFTVALPTGWKTSMSLNRVSQLDVRPSWYAISSDGTGIASGDPSLPMFSVPSGYTRMAGIGIGRRYSPGPGVSMIVEPYMRGLAFAQYYAQTKFGASCTGVRIDSAQERGDAAAAMNASFRAYGLPVQLSAGDVHFSCTRHGQAMRGYVFAGTQYYSAGTNAIWNVAYLLAYLAPTSHENEAAIALRHAAATYRTDDAWAARAGQAALATSRAMEQSQQQIGALIAQRSQNSDTEFNAIDNYDQKAVRGEQTVTDPVLGQTFSIDDRYEYNWIDHDGNIVGSDTSASPGMDWRQLIP